MDEGWSIIHNRKRKRTETEDHQRGGEETVGINLLTDDTLCFILSFLSTKEAARTSVLSKRWKNLWKSTKSIKLDIDEVLGMFPHGRGRPLSNRRIEDFIRVVDQCLRKNLNPLTKTFHLHLCSRIPSEHIGDWIRLVAERRIENLTLDFSGAPGYCYIPTEVGLKQLSLTRCRLMSISDDELNDANNSLLTLSLKDVILPNNFQNFISGCPKLRSLSIQNCKALMEMKILHPLHSLKYLKVVNSGERIRVHAKNLEKLECLGFSQLLLYASIDEWGNPNALSFCSANYPNICTPDPCFGGFKNLRELALRSRFVKLSQVVLNNLMANCFALQQLSLEDCVMPSNLQISGLVNLETLKLTNCRGLKNLQVFARSLKRFEFTCEKEDYYPRDSFELLDDYGNNFSSVPGKGSPLKHLHLQRSKFSIDLPQFRSLKTIALEEVELDEADIINLVSNCLLLEKLSIIKCTGFDSLNIMGTSLQLKQLTVRWCSYLKEIEICDVNLIRFEYHGKMIVFSLREVSQLVSVEMEIDANDDDEYSVTNALSMFSRDVPQLETLIFYVEGGKVPESPPMFYNLKHLVVFLGGNMTMAEELSWATTFLAASPFLEKYHLQLSRCLLEDAILDTSKPTWLPWTFTNPCLEEIELLRFKGSSKEIEFAYFVLQNAKSSMKMKINGGWKHRAGDDTTQEPPLEWVQSGRQKTREQMSKTNVVPDGVNLQIL